jgi:putative ABC transport system permease protein
MRLIDYITLAFRNIRRQKLRSALTVFAIVIGATSVTIMLALVFSLKGFMTKQFEANGTFQQVVVSPQTDLTWDERNNSGDQCNNCTKLTDDLVDKIKNEPHVTGVSRQAPVNAFQAIAYGNNKLRIYQISAYDANGIQKNTMVAGRDITDEDKQGVLTITANYADKLGFKNNYQSIVGKQIKLITRSFYTGVGSDPLKAYQEQSAWFQAHPGADGRDYQPAPVELTGTVVGVTSNEDDSYSIRVPLDWSRAMNLNQNYQVTPEAVEAAQAKCRASRVPNCNTQPEPSLVVTDELAKNGYSSLIVKVDQTSNAVGVAKNIKNTYKVGAVDAQTAIKQQLAIFNILGAVLGGIGGIALMVAAVGVVNTMIMAILERTREIGVMRAVGARRGTVSRLFTFEAALLGFMGGVVGLGVGYALILGANPLINKQLQSNGIVSRNIVTLPPWLLLGVIVITTLIGLLAGLYPARRAARLDPVEALHYE